jgi:hypothetical protein
VNMSAIYIYIDSMKLCNNDSLITDYMFNMSNVVRRSEAKERISRTVIVCRFGSVPGT